MTTTCTAQVRRGQAGFSMLEVLISIVLIVIALLGQAGIVISAMKSNKGATFRMQAVLLSDEIAEHMEGNKSAATAAAYAVPQQSSVPDVMTSDCAMVACNPAALAAYDLAIWERRVAQTLPAATWQITNPVVGNPSTYTIVLTWQDRRENTRAVRYATTGNTETFAITASKVVYR